MRTVAGVVQPGVLLAVMVMRFVAMSMVMVSVVSIVVMVVATMRAISPRLGLERCFDFADDAAQPFDHLGQHVIALEAQDATAVRGQNLYRHMAIPQVIGRTGKQQGRIGDDLDQLFGRCDDFDHRSAILRKQPIAPMQVIAALQENTGLGARGERHLETAAFAFVVG